MARPWLYEFWRFIATLVAAFFIGLLFDHVWLFLFLASLVYLLRQFTNLYQLDNLLAGKRRGYPSNRQGVWGDIYYNLYRLQKRNRRRKKKLANMLGRFRESTDAMPDATIILGKNSEIEWWNKAASKLLHLKSPHDSGQIITNLLRHPVFTAFIEKGDYNQPVQFPSPHDERVMLSVRIVPYGKDARLLIARDVSQLHLLEMMRRDFVANVSHELRTPLTVILGYLETLEEELQEGGSHWPQSLSAMQKQAHRMQSVVTDLLLLSRLETEKGRLAQKPVDIPGMLEMIREDASVLSGDQHNFHLEADRSVWLLGADQELRSAFSNLIYNAVQYTPKNGSINIRWYQDERGAHFEVKDTGVGIAPANIPRLTERFFRVDVARSRDTGGTGLGLAIVKHVLNRHDARLDIKSELGKGSTFRCDFPPQRIKVEVLQKVNP